MTATAASMDLTLAARSDYSAVRFDDVTLEAVPEPGGLWLPAAALLLLGLLRRR